MLYDITIVLLLGYLGFLVFSKLSVPSPAILGSIIVLGIMRALDFPIPAFPPSIFPLIQIVLGLFLGTKITRGVLKEIKSVYKPSIIIVVWTVSIIFFLGFLLTSITDLNIHTAILSSAMGGLPEMMVLALVADTNISFVILMQSIRLLLTVMIFPLLFNHWMKNDKSDLAHGIENKYSETTSLSDGINISKRFFRLPFGTDNLNTKADNKELRDRLGNLVLLLLIATAGGVLFIQIGVPAGGMIGAMLFVAIFSIAGIQFKPLSPKLLILVQICVGIMATENITSDTVKALASLETLWIVLLISFVTFGSSILVSFLIYKTTDWDYPTCFLVSSPGGFSAIMALSVQYNIEPLRISIVHLCRLLIIKMIIPLFYMLYG